MEMVKVRYIGPKAATLKQGKVYEAFRPKDDLKGNFWAVYLEGFGSDAYYAIDAAYFEVVNE